MISLELARELKKAGLVWEPKEGDSVYDYFDTFGRIGHEEGHLYLQSDNYGKTWCVGYQYHECQAWAPSLSQLLAEIEGRGYWWEINHRLIDNRTKKYKMWVSKKHKNNNEWRFMADTPEEAAGQALLWILKGVGRDG